MSVHSKRSRGSSSFWDSPWIDEALARREGRRMRRWLRSWRVPVLYLAGLVAVAWVVAPALMALSGSGGRLLREPTWPFAGLLAAAVAGAMGVAFTRGTQFWWSEQNAGTLTEWLVSGQEPRAVVATATGAAVFVAAVVSLPAGLVMALHALNALRHGGAPLPLSPASFSMAALLSAFSVLAGSCLASVTFFLVTRTRPGRPAIAAGALFGLLWLALWLWLEGAERGWHGAWENHPLRVLFALLLLTPIPHLCGIAAGNWWAAEMTVRLPGHPSAVVTSLLLALIYAVEFGLLLAASERGFRRLREQPELLERRRTATSAREEEPEPYWSGFRNPVWTCDFRTRLRSRESAEVLFFAAFAIAAAGFIPLFVAGGQLGDPLRTAAVAREVFFWLAMTLAAFLTLLTPGVTAEAVGLERARGTLELLLASPISASEILRGKLLGALSMVALLLSPSLPLFSLCTLFHGASADQVIGIYAALVLHMAVCGFFGVTASAIHARLLPAKIQAYVLAFLFSCLPGGALWVVAALALPTAGAREEISTTWVLAPGLVTFTFAMIAWSWGAAVERLRYLEREPWN